MKARKKPVVIEAYQWFKNGDHPRDASYIIDGSEGPFLSEGSIVRRFRHPDISGQTPCSKCAHTMHDHGWIDTLEDGHNVCPGDYIITGAVGENYPIKAHVFELTYDVVEE